MSEQDILYNLCSVTHTELEEEVGQPIPLNKMQDWMQAIKKRLVEALVDDLGDLLDPDYVSDDPELQRLLKAVHDAEDAKDDAYAAAYEDKACRAIVEKARDAKDAAHAALRESDAHKAYRAALDAADAEHERAMGPYVDAPRAALDKALKEFRDYQSKHNLPLTPYVKLNLDDDKVQIDQIDED